jgi:hydroxypyruvate isomerase
MRTIAETGYTGFVGHEFVPLGDPLAAMQAAYTTCDV